MDGCKFEHPVLVQEDGRAVSLQDTRCLPRDGAQHFLKLHAAGDRQANIANSLQLVRAPGERIDNLEADQRIAGEQGRARADVHANRAVA